MHDHHDQREWQVAVNAHTGRLWRLVGAYGGLYALIGSAVIVAVGLVSQQQVLGVTRQPLPLVWPLTVVHVTLAQLPLRDVFGPMERVSARGATSRALRAAVALLLIGAGIGTYLAARGEHALLVFCLLLTALGFTVAALGRSDCWVWTLGVGLLTVGLAYITPLGGPIGGVLDAIPVAAAATVAVASAVAFIATGRGRRR